MALYFVLSARERAYSCSPLAARARHDDTTLPRQSDVLRGTVDAVGNSSCHSSTPPPRRQPTLGTPSPSRSENETRTMFLGWLVHKWGVGFGRRGRGTRFGCGCRPKTERTREGAGRLPAAKTQNTNRCSRAGPQRRTPTPRAASLACLARALTARTSSTSMAGFWWSRPSAPRMTCARRFSRKPPAVATGPLSTSARS